MKKFNELSKEEEQRAIDLHSKAVVIEGHTHYRHDMEKVLPSLREGGISGRVLDLTGVHDRQAFLKTPYPETVVYNYEGHARRFMVQMDNLLPEFDKHSDEVSMAFSAEDFVKAKQEGKIAILLGLEGGNPLEGRLETLRCYYRLGLRYMQLTWCLRNQLADGYFEHTNSGLTDFGKDVVKDMNRLGMVVGIAHISEKGFFDTLETSEDPVVITHATARAVRARGAHQDPPFGGKLSDEQLKALAEKDGVMGLLCHYSHHIIQYTRRKVATIEDVLDHIDHVSELVGVDHVALGPDWDIGGPQEATKKTSKRAQILRKWKDLPIVVYPPEHSLVQDYEDVTKTSNFTRGLVARGYSDQEILKFLGGNWLRVFKSVFGN